MYYRLKKAKAMADNIPYFVVASFQLLTPSYTSGSWSTVYSLKEEHLIGRNQLLTTIPLLKKEWRVSFLFKADEFEGLAQVLHLTTGGKGSGGGAKYGDRTPAIWVHPTKGFLISSAVGGKISYSKYLGALPSTGKWTIIEISQEMVANAMIYSVTIGGNEVFSTENTEASDFENVQVFASSTWYSPVNGLIKNLLIENKNGGGLKVTNTSFLVIFSFKGCLLLEASLASSPFIRAK